MFYTLPAAPLVPDFLQSAIWWCPQQINHMLTRDIVAFLQNDLVSLKNENWPVVVDSYGWAEMCVDGGISAVLFFKFTVASFINNFVVVLKS